MRRSHVAIHLGALAVAATALTVVLLNRSNVHPAAGRPSTAPGITCTGYTTELCDQLLAEINHPSAHSTLFTEKCDAACAAQRLTAVASVPFQGTVEPTITTGGWIDLGAVADIIMPIHAVEPGGAVTISTANEQAEQRELVAAVAATAPGADIHIVPRAPFLTSIIMSSTTHISTRYSGYRLVPRVEVQWIRIRTVVTPGGGRPQQTVDHWRLNVRTYGWDIAGATLGAQPVQMPAANALFGN